MHRENGGVPGWLSELLRTAEGLVPPAEASRRASRLLRSNEPQRRMLLQGVRYGRLEVAYELLRRLDEGEGRQDARSLAMCVLLIVQRSSAPEALLADLAAQAFVWMAVACRRQGDLAGAGVYLDEARELLEAGAGCPLARGLVEHLSATVSGEQLRDAESVRHARAAVRAYRTAGDLHRAAKARISLAIALRDGGDARAALAELRTAVRDLDVAREPKAAGAAVLSAAGCALEADAPELATALLDALDAAPRSSTDLRGRCWWLRGRLAAGSGEWLQALVYLERAHAELRGLDALRRGVLAVELGAAYLTVGRGGRGYALVRGGAALLESSGFEVAPLRALQDRLIAAKYADAATAWRELEAALSPRRRA